MIVETTGAPGTYTDLPLVTRPGPETRLEGSPGTRVRWAGLWRGALRALTVRHQGSAGMLTGISWLDDVTSGLREGTTTLLCSPGREAVATAERAMHTARAAGVPQTVVDPSGWWRHEARGLERETMREVLRPASWDALTSRSPERLFASPRRLVVVALPRSLDRPLGRRELGQVSAWLRALQAAAQRQRGIVLLVEPWSGLGPGPALRAVMRAGAQAIRIEALMDGGVAARNMMNGVRRVVDARGWADLRRERAALGRAGGGPGMRGPSGRSAAA